MNNSPKHAGAKAGERINNVFESSRTLADTTATPNNPLLSPQSSNSRIIMQKEWTKKSQQRLLNKIDSNRVISMMVPRPLPSTKVISPVNQSVVLEKHLPAPLDEELSHMLYRSVNKPFSQLNMLKSSQNFQNKLKKPSMINLDLLSKRNQSKRNFITVTNTTTHHSKDKDRQTIAPGDRDFRLLTNESSLNLKDSYIDRLQGAEVDLRERRLDLDDGIMS